MRWEYKSVQMETTGLMGGKLDQEAVEKKLNALGEQGWELQSAFDTNQAYGASRYVVLLFKRPRG